MSTLPVQQRIRGGALTLLLVLGLPAFSYPLSWLPRSWAHFRFNCILPLPEIVLAVALLASIWFLLRERPNAETGEQGVTIVVPRALLMPLLAVVLSGLVSTRFSAHSYLGLDLLPRLAGNVVIFLIVAHVAREQMSGLCRWWVVVAVLVAGNGLLRLGSEPDFISTLGNRNFLAAYLAASVVIDISIGGTRFLLGSFILLGAMAFCSSRGAWLALGTVAMLWFLGCGNGLVRQWQARAAIVLVILAGSGLLARPYIMRQWQTDVRPMIWKATLHMIATRPLLGHGLGTYVMEYPQYRLPEYFLRPKATNVTDHAHNELLEVAAEQGLIGLAATLWLWATAIWCGLRASRRVDKAEHRFIMGLLGATVLLMLHGLVDIDLRHLPNQSLLWLLMGLLVGADTTPSRSRRVTIRPRSARMSAAAACLVLGVWIVVNSILRPMLADLRDRRARIAEERGDLATVAQSAWEALRIQPFRLSTQYLLAGVLSRLPDPRANQLAIEQCLRIEELAPDYADVTYNLGQLYLAAGQAAEALPYLRRAAQINPYDVERRVVLAEALQAVGQNDEAHRQLDYALQTRPDNPGARELLQKIHKEHNP